MPKVTVIGAGISGLAAGFELVERGLPREDLLVLEGESRAGGNIRTGSDEGFTIEHGPNGFLDNSPPTLDLVRRLGMEDRLLPSRDTSSIRFIFRGGALRAVPMNPIALLRSSLLSVPGRIRIFREPFVPKGGAPDESVFDFAARRIGKEAARVMVDSMVSGVFAGDAKRLELRAAFPRMAEFEEKHGGLVKAMIALRTEKKKKGSPGKSKGGPAGPGGRLTSFRNGMDELTGALADRIGPSLRTGAPAAALAREEGEYTVTLGSGETVRTDRVILATPAPVSSLLTAPIDGDLSALLSQIPGTSVAVVATAYDREKLHPAPHGFGFLVPRGEGPRILGCLWTSSIWEDRAPDNRFLLRTMVGGAHDPDAAGLSDEDLYALVDDDLKLTMGLRVEPVFRRIYRYRLGIPQYPPGHTARVDRIRGILERYPGLLVSGNSYGGISMNHCIAEAPRVAEAALRD